MEYVIAIMAMFLLVIGLTMEPTSATITQSQIRSAAIVCEKQGSSLSKITLKVKTLEVECESGPIFTLQKG